MSIALHDRLPVRWPAASGWARKEHVAERPELWVWPNALVASAAFVSLMQWSGHHASTDMAHSSMTMSMPMTEHMKMGTASNPMTASVIIALTLAWVAMVVAMMLPAAVPSIRYVAFTSLRQRRARAMALFSVGFVAVWLPGAIGVVSWHLTQPVSVKVATAVGFGLAALWEFTPQKRRALQRCHRTVPIRLAGRAADRSCFGFGLLSGGRCMRSCGPAMFVVVVAGHSPATLTLVTVAMFAQQLVTRGERLTGAVGVAFTLVALAILVT